LGLSILVCKERALGRFAHTRHFKARAADDLRICEPSILRAAAKSSLTGTSGRDFPLGRNCPMRQKLPKAPGKYFHFE
jgi:hypothetical protein